MDTKLFLVFGKQWNRKHFQNLFGPDVIGECVTQMNYCDTN